MPTTLHLVRHAQGLHNLSAANQQLPDPELTDLGKEQCAELHRSFPFHDQITHVVASPMRRTLYTALYSFRPEAAAAADAIENGVTDSSASDSWKVIALPEIQEVSSLPCDTGSDPEKLAAEFAQLPVDLALLKPGWNDKSRGGPWAPEMQALEERARKARVWLRKLGAEFEKAGGGGEKEEREAHIVAVTHGGFLHILTEDWDGMDPSKGTGWQNAEYRSYQFHDPSGQDPEAHITETRDSWRARRGSQIGLTEAEQTQMRIVQQEALQRELDEIDAAKKHAPQ